MSERDFALCVVERLQKAGYQALWAGGCVRDELLGIPPLDYDVATNAHPGEVRKLFPRTVAVGESFGVIEIIGPFKPEGGHFLVQVATFRSDGVYTDGRRPDQVTFSSAEEDAQRRDFTINGMFFDPIAEELIDYVGGQHDLAAKVLRAIGNPLERFTEDKLRMLRGVRMASRFDLDVDPRTLAAAQSMADQIKVVSAERISDEMHKMLIHPRRVRAIRLMNEFRLLAPILPEIASLGTLEQLITILAKLEAPQWPTPSTVTFPLCFAALLHQLAKKVVLEICHRFRLSNEERDRIVWLTSHHQQLQSPDTLKRSQLFPILVHPGIGELLALHSALALAIGQPDGHVGYCLDILRNIPFATLNPEPLITGETLKDRGLEPGPRFKTILDNVRNAQLDQEITSPAEALALVDQIVNRTE